MPEGLIVALAIAGFLIVFPLFWSAVVFLISRFSGWSGMAAHFAIPPDKKVTGDSFGWSSVQFNLFTSYSGCVDIVVSRQGLYLRPVWPFRFGHEPLLVPWTAIEDVRSHDRWLFTANKVTIRKPGGWSKTLTFYGKRLGDSLFRNWTKASGN